MRVLISIDEHLHLAYRSSSVLIRVVSSQEAQGISKSI